MPAHVFVLRGDLRKLNCDGWLLPTAADLVVERQWLDEDVDAGRLDLQQVALAGRTAYHIPMTAPAAWGDSGERTIRWRRLGEGPRAWLVNVGGHGGTPPEWYLEGARQFVARAASDLGKNPSDRRTLAEDRKRPLVALPVIGTGHGGKMLEKAELIRQLLKTLQSAARESDVDIALVAYNEESFAASQRARRELDRDGKAWSVLSSPVAAVGRLLAEKAVSGQLVLFLGAGVSKGAGLPLWGQLLGELAEAAGFDGLEGETLRKMDPLDQARLIELKLGHRERLQEAIRTRLDVRHHSLAHGLLAGLPVDSVVTLNYDQLFEKAAQAAQNPVAVLPTAPSRSVQRWLLKLHGCVSSPADIVLTREDYMRYGDRRAALMGIVQALLITRHMLFVGFGLDDVNFHHIADDVRKALGPGRPRDGRFGTALALQPDPLRARLWDADLELIDVTVGAAGDDQPGRMLEVLLDYVLHETSHRPSYLMRSEFDALLSNEERRFRDDLAELHRRHDGRLRQSPAWERFEGLLRDLGRSR